MTFLPRYFGFPRHHHSTTRMRIRTQSEAGSIPYSLVFKETKASSHTILSSERVLKINGRSPRPIGGTENGRCAEAHRPFLCGEPSEGDGLACLGVLGQEHIHAKGEEDAEEHRDDSADSLQERCVVGHRLRRGYHERGADDFHQEHRGEPQRRACDGVRVSLNATVAEGSAPLPAVESCQRGQEQGEQDHSDDSDEEHDCLSVVLLPFRYDTNTLPFARESALKVNVSLLHTRWCLTKLKLSRTPIESVNRPFWLCIK